MNRDSISPAESEGTVAGPNGALSAVTDIELSSGTPEFGAHAGPAHAPPPIADHELLRMIGRGAYGEVWLARNIMGSYRAVKIVYRDSFESDRPYEREFSGIQNFEPVSRSHESQVHILHVSRNDDVQCFYYVMELADDALTGQKINPETYNPRSIRSELKQRGRFSLAETIEISLSLATALKHLHGYGLIHRDIKPANIIFVNDRAKLADIGLVTETGATMSYVGTEGYLPPEGPGSVQADIYSLGKTLYELATGKDRMDFPELPSLVGNPAEETQLFELNEILLKMCHSDLQQRYRDAGELYDDLILLQAGKSIRRSHAVERRLALLTKLAAVIFALSVRTFGGWLYQRRLSLKNEELATALQANEAEHFFERDDANKGIAYLARTVRQNPRNEIAAARLLSALNDRSFALPLRSFSPGAFQGAEFHPDSKHIVSWTEPSGLASNCVAQLFNLETGSAVGARMDHPAHIREARFSPNGRYLATLMASGVARIWNTSTGELLKELPSSGYVYREYMLILNRIAFSPDSGTLAFAGGNSARLFNLTEGVLFTNLFEHGATISDVAFSPDGQRLAISGEMVTSLWKVSSRDWEKDLRLQDGGQCIAKFCPERRRLLTAGGFCVQVWDYSGNKEKVRFPLNGVFSTARFSPDGCRIATSQERWVHIFDSETGRVTFAPLAHGAEVQDAIFDPTGERLLTWERRRARVWDSRTGRPLTEWMQHTNDISTARFAPDGKKVLTASVGQSVTIWDIRPGKAPNLRIAGTAILPLAHFSPDGASFLTAFGGDVEPWSQGDAPWAKLVVWNSRTGERLMRTLRLTNGVHDAEFSPDGLKVVTGSKGGEAQIWSVRTGAPIGKAMQHKDRVWSARWSASGKKIVTGSADNTARVWDGETGEPLTPPLLHTQAVRNACFSPDGSRVLTLSVGGPVRMWNAETGEFIADFPRVDASAFACSPDGRTVAVGYLDGAALIYDLRTRTAIGAPLRHQTRIRSISFNPDGRHLATGSDDQTARIWDTQTGKPITRPLAHKSVISRVNFSSDGRQLVTASYDSTARVWDVLTGRPVTEPLREENWISHAEFSPDNTRIVVANAEGVARVHDLIPIRKPLPTWLPDLAEALAGQLWTDDYAPEVLPPSRFLKLRQDLSNDLSDNVYSRWLKWFFADRSTRTVSHTSAIPVSAYFDGLLAEPYMRSLREAVHLAPDDAHATVRLAEQTLIGEEPHPLEQAEFLARRALQIDPSGHEGWAALTRVFMQTGRSREVLDLVRGSLVKTNGAALGALRCEWFFNIPGNSLARLQNEAKFPDRPDLVDFIDSFELPANFATNDLAVRITGYVIPPKSGEYRFYLCADDEGVLFLSDNKSPAGKREIARQAPWNWPRHWQNDLSVAAESRSRLIHLEAGRRYYVEALLKQHLSQYNLAVLWQIPGEDPPVFEDPGLQSSCLAIPVDWLAGPRK